MRTKRSRASKRGPRIEKGEPTGPGPDKRIRKHFQQTQDGRVRRCKFEYAKLGAHGQIYECDLQGSAIVIQWNIEHPFINRSSSISGRTAGWSRLWTT